MDGGGFLSQGGYGCVFYPEINCKGEDTDNKRFLSKIVEKSFNAQNEIKISKLLNTKLKKWVENPLKNNFAPVLANCPVTVNQFDIHEQDKCDLFKKRDDQFILMKIRYINGNELDSFITQNSNSSLIMLIFTSSYTHLLKSLQIMARARICHFDIKGQNIIYDIESSLPIIIDFGLSINFAKLNIAKPNITKLYDYFYIYEPMYYLWPLEVHLVNYILHVNSELKRADMRKIAKEYVHNNVVLRIFSPDFQKKYENECYYELNKYVGKNMNGIIARILKYWHTWDNYALSLLYMKLLHSLIKNDDGKVSQNQFVSFFIKMCLSNIHPNPKKRLTINATIKTFNRFLYNQQIDKKSVFEDIIMHIDKNKTTINKTILTNRRYMTTLAERTIR